MPHITVEYSTNLESRVDIQGLLHAVHAAVLASGMAPIGGVRTRAAPRELYVIADAAPDNAFVAILCRIGTGRDEATRAAFAQFVFDAASAFLDAAFGTTPLALSVDIEQIERVGSLKRNNLHDRMKASTAGAAVG